MLLDGKVGKCMAPRDAGMALRKISSAYFSPVLYVNVKLLCQTASTLKTKTFAVVLLRSGKLQSTIVHLDMDRHPSVLELRTAKLINKDKIYLFKCILLDLIEYTVCSQNPRPLHKQTFACFKQLSE